MEVEDESNVSEVREGKARIQFDKRVNKIFYNAPQEVNRDISIVGAQTHLLREGKKNGVLLEAMAASGIRSIRYALEVSGLTKVIANDYSKACVSSIEANSKLNATEALVESSFNDANVIMRTAKSFIIDMDPYGSPATFIDAAIQGIEDGGLFIVTATDMAGLAGGNAAEACFAKYGAMPLKIKACHEMALRILIHTVQSTANRYGRVVIPLLSLKIDFYVRLFFKVIKSAEKAKLSSINTALVYHCTGCKTINFQPMAARKSEKVFAFARGPTVPEKCANCSSVHHIGGPIWIGSIHDQEFVLKMTTTLKEKYSYLNTYSRIEVVAEEVDVPLFYDVSELCSVLQMGTIPFITMRSAILNAGYKVSLSHCAPNSIKTNCPNAVLWDILKAWRLKTVDSPAKNTVALNIMAHPIISSTVPISFEGHPDANPVSRINNLMRYQMNPTKNWGPGVRNAFKGGQEKAEERRERNQGKRTRPESNMNSDASAGNNSSAVDMATKKIPKVELGN